MCKARRSKIVWVNSIFFSLAISVSANDVEEHFLDNSLEEILQMPLDMNTVNIQESHIHKKDEWMLGYRYMYMDMQGLQAGTNRLSSDDILQNYQIAPTHMSMEMHMFSLMYAPTDDITLMAMLPYKSHRMTMLMKPMNMNTGMASSSNMANSENQSFSTHSEGLGDLKIMANGVLYRSRWDKHIVSLKGGLSLPVGSINKRDDTPMMANMVLPYSMQLGSGTTDFLTGVSYTGLSRDWSWGTQLLGRLHTGRNRNHYRLGDKLDTSIWLSRIWKSWISSSMRFEGEWWESIHGSNPDSDAMKMMSPMANATLTGGSRVNMLLSTELYAPQGMLKGQHLGIEVGFPLYQSLKGPQMTTDWTVSMGWQWTF